MLINKKTHPKIVICLGRDLVDGFPLVIAVCFDSPLIIKEEDYFLEDFGFLLGRIFSTMGDDENQIYILKKIPIPDKAKPMYTSHGT